MKTHRDIKKDLIKRSPLFEGSTPHQIDEIAATADEIDLRRGTLLTRENAIGREFVVLLDGTAEVRRDGTTVAHLQPGDWFGEIALLTSRRRNATVVATSRVRALVFAHHQFQTLVDTMPHVRARLEGVLLDRSA